jgi:hypothetical protein
VGFALNPISASISLTGREIRWSRAIETGSVPSLRDFALPPAGELIHQRGNGSLYDIDGGVLLFQVSMALGWAQTCIKPAPRDRLKSVLRVTPVVELVGRDVREIHRCDW